ncbi:MAG: Gfo/Idh/MocA family oxidoreductase [Candidatus Solibacter sp.]|nr:Gfo/Idh/MocA family oxidoreductase [Candidatus Solibacter sp.]
MQRRDLLKSAAVGAGLTILRSGTLRGQNAPSNKLNVALMGVWGRGTAHYNVLRNENVVALCDVNDNRTKEALAIFPKAKTYWDWRRVMDQKDVEAVIICTADHHHAFIANWAMNRNMHVYCEKPMGMSVEEVRTLRANYLSKKSRLATQHGTQRHAYPNFERIRELILDGTIGDPKTIHGWDARQLPRPGYPAGEGMPPAILHYEQWIGPSPYHPYSPQYFGGSSGLNCLFWNMYRDFGVGEIDQDVSDKYDPNICPVKLKATFDHPANSWRGPVQVVWYQGGLKPTPPKSYIDVTRVGNGAIFEGTKGAIFADFTSRLIIPNNDDGDLTYYKRRAKQDTLPLVGGTGQVTQAPPRPAGAGAAPAGGRGAQARRGGQGGRGGGPGGRGALPPGFSANPSAEPQPGGFPAVQMLEGGIPAALGMPNNDVQRILTAEQSGAPRPAAGGDVFQAEWIDACKGKSNTVTHGTSSKTHCDFDYSGTMMEQMLLGLVAHQVGKKITYDPATGRVTNAPEANDYLKRTYRSGWTLNG